MKFIKIFILCAVIAFSSCNGINDISKNLSGGYTYRADGKYATILPNNIFKKRIDPDVKEYTYNDNFILAIQKPNLERFKNSLAYYLSTRFAILSRADSTNKELKIRRIRVL